MTLFAIRMRQRILVNTDPQGRCYNNCHYSSEHQWTAWTALGINLPADKAERRLAYWRDLNAYAVSQRGEGAIAEFEAVPETSA